MIAQHSCSSYNWGTPAFWVERCRTAMGGIDLDPCSSPEHDQTVLAGRYYTEKENALQCEWHGRAFINPPGGRGLPQKFFEKLKVELLSGRCTQAIWLAYSLEQLLWIGRAMRGEFSMSFEPEIAIPHKRIQFLGAGKSPTHGNAFLHFGPFLSRDKFRRVFSPDCLILS